jgi:hypothetical protein
VHSIMLPIVDGALFKQHAGSYDVGCQITAPWVGLLALEVCTLLPVALSFRLQATLQSGHKPAALERLPLP